ncbi:AAA family ATPase [Aeromonas sp. R7-2]|uniref:AAA family ATPase n=1 Tax=Aeromonas sp. R7-2 TaxID=3138474 RepID=UPI0034A2EA8B
MRLKSIYFIENKGQPTEWELKDLSLGAINLIVGKNATGKSRTLNIISHLANIISGTPLLPGQTYYYKVVFDSEFETTYELDVFNGVILTEKLIVSDNYKIIKGPTDSTTKVYFETIQSYLESQFTPNFLCASQRDIIQKPYLEPLFNWALNTIHTRFGTPLGQNTLYLFAPDSEFLSDYKNVEAVSTHLKDAERKGIFEKLKSEIITDLKYIGYDVDDIGCVEAGIANNQKVYKIFVKEKDIKVPVFQENMSQGMFRAISVIVHYNYIILDNKKCCLLVDDIGEGLDFDRSTSLIKKICEKAESAKYQIIMTSNDRFVMNQVDLSYWSVLVRNGQSCRAINKFNSESIFRKFKYTGLNNFDFFSTDFYQGAE